MTGRSQSAAAGRGPDVRSRRIAAGMSLRRFAAQLGIRHQSLSDYETGQSAMPEDVWSRAVALLDDAAAGRDASQLHPDDGPRPEVHPLTAVRCAHGWSLLDLARRHAAIAGGAVDRQKIWRWEKWGTVPDRQSQLALAKLLGVPASSVLAQPWPAWLPGTDGADVNSPWDLRGVLAALHATGEAAMDRRGFLTLSSAAIGVLAERWGADVVRMMPGVLPVDVTQGSADDVVTTFEARLPVVRAQESLYGGSRVLGAVSAELATARQMLNWPMGSAARQRLLRVTAELSRVGGWAAIDAGRPAAAETYFVAALRAAHQARDPGIAANTVKSFSLLLVESGRPEDAQRLLAAGERVAARGPVRVQAMVATRQARTAAVLGNARAAQEALGVAADLFERALDSDDDPPETAYFGHAELAAQTAASHQILGHHATAIRLLETALGPELEARPRDRATYQLWLCRSALAQRDPDRVHAVLEDAPQGLSPAGVAASARNQVLLSALRRQLASYQGHPAARELDERLRHLIA